MKRWAVAGVLLGSLLALLVWPPAAWLASAQARARDGRRLLADASGSIWSGSAVPVLTGGPGSRAAAQLPGRLRWTLRPDGAALLLALQHDCCIDGTLRVRVVPGLGQWRLELPATAAGAQAPAAGQAPAAALAHWPAAWLSGLGTPFNTLDLSGTLILGTPGLTLESARGRWRLDGRAELTLQGLSSRVSTVEPLGDYRLQLQGAGDGPATLRLQTLAGALVLDGQGSLAGPVLRFQGSARAAPGYEAVLSNLLNIIGRRQGERSIITIG